LFDTDTRLSRTSYTRTKCNQLQRKNKRIWTRYRSIPSVMWNFGTYNTNITIGKEDAVNNLLQFEFIIHLECLSSSFFFIIINCKVWVMHLRPEPVPGEHIERECCKLPSHNARP
jgi:hypothetical protein